MQPRSPRTELCSGAGHSRGALVQGLRPEPHVVQGLTLIKLSVKLEIVKYFAKKALLVSGILLLPLLLKIPSYAQNLAPRLPTSAPKTEEPVREVIVVFNQKPNTRALLNLASQNSNLKPEHGIASSNAVVYSIKDGDLENTVSKLSQNQNVKTVFPNYRLRAMKTTNDPGLTLQWSMVNLKLAGQGNSAWDVTGGSASISVAVIDTGVESIHPDLVGKIASLVDCSGTNCLEVTSMTDPDTGGHGTHVTGLVAAATNNGKGVAGSGFDTRVAVIKIMDAAGTIDVGNLFKALVWAADHGIKVVNMSVGQVEENLDTASINEMKQNIDYAWNKGVLMIAAAGNCGGNTDSNDCAILNGSGNVSGYAHNSKVYPGAFQNVLSVASLTKNNTIASYSERNDAGNAKIGNWVSVAAPGGECNPDTNIEDCIFSTIPQNILPTPPPPEPAYDPYFYNMGTSMASPQVAGVAALVLAVNPNLTNSQVKSIIESSANKSVAPGATNFGAVDALAAVTAASGGGGEISVTPGGPTLTGAPPPKPPTATSYPTVPPFMRNQEPSPFPTGPYCPQTFLPGGNCSLESKNSGDANCDGSINALDFSLWLNQLDKMVPPQPVNQSANFSCTEGNKSTYFVDMADFEIWRRNTTEGLVTPAPTD